MARILIYGANGYSGRLVTAQAQKNNLDITLAGRNEEAVNQLAEQTQLPCLVFDLSSRQNIAKQISGFDIVINCAGPFSQTARSMVSACLDQKVHYLDITGEINVFKHCHRLDNPAKKAGIILCPGVGFDVVPTDCIAARLNQSIEDANYLALGFDSRSSLSRGTRNTMIEGLALGNFVREEHQLRQVPFGYRTRQIDFGDGLKTAVNISWGDLATAYFQTQIPNIEVFIPLSPRKVQQLKWLNRVQFAFKWRWLQNMLVRKSAQQPAGPDQTQRENSKTYVWGEAINPKGDIVQAFLTVDNGYQFTAKAAVSALEAVAAMPKSTSGYFTPAQLFGAGFVESIDGSSMIEVKQLN